MTTLVDCGLSRHLLWRQGSLLLQQQGPRILCSGQFALMAAPIFDFVAAAQPHAERKVQNFRDQRIVLMPTGNVPVDRRISLHNLRQQGGSGVRKVGTSVRIQVRLVESAKQTVTPLPLAPDSTPQVVCPLGHHPR